MSLNLADLFEVVADAVPDRLALVAGDARRTYRDLDERSTRLAHALADRGVRAGEHIAVLSHNRAEWIETMLAAFKLRAVPINVNYRYVAEELRYVLENSDAVAIVHEPEFETVLKEADAGVRFTLRIDDDYDDALASASAARALAARSSDDRYILYTGGTTGMPKGVVWRHEDIFFAALGGGGFGQEPIREAAALAQRLPPEESRFVPFVTAPMMHGGGQWMSLITFFGGGTVVLYTARHFDPHEVWRIVERERCNQIMVVGDAMARPLAEALERDRYDASSVFVIGSGGATLSESVRAQLAAQLPHAVVMDNFGASETGAAGPVTDPHDPRGPKFAMSPTVAVLGDDLRPVRPGSGVVGRLARRGHIPLEYYKDPAKTAATFVTDPDGVRWVVPGDMALVDEDGGVVLLGRGSQCINTGGEKVYPEEVEGVLRGHPDVFDALVVGVPDERYVEAVAAVVAPRDGRAPTLEALQEHCRARLAGYKVPRAVVLVDRIGRTPAGKPDYRWASAVATRA